MKKTGIVCAFIIVLLSLQSCEEEIEKEQITFAYEFSDCKYLKSTTEDISDESIQYKYEDGDLVLEHKNVMFNCCQTENNLKTQLLVVGDSIYVNEFERVPGLCKCICPYDLSCRIRSLEEQEYWIIMQIGGEEKIRFLIDFNEELDGVKTL